MTLSRSRWWRLPTPQSDDHAKRSYCVVDVETTGLEPLTDRIVEIAIVRVDGRGRVLDEAEHLVASPRLGASAVHGITEGDLRAAPAFGDVAAGVLRMLTDSIVVGHNVAFDLAFLDAEFERTGMDRPSLPSLPSLCTMAIGHSLGLHGGRISLDDACAQLEVPIEGRHRALGDARATSDLFAAQFADARARVAPFGRARGGQ